VVFDLVQVNIGIIGLGYVGLPLAVAFAREFPTRGFDPDSRRIDELERGIDRNSEVIGQEFDKKSQLSLHRSAEALANCNVYVVAVPTPINEHKRPDLKPLRDASRLIGGMLKKDDVVIFESTVYPGATEEICVPILELESGLILHQDFHVGYSPERINPGDKQHTLQSITKLVSGSSPETTEFVGQLYSKIIDAGVHPTESIRVAEAAKVIENVQRDVNIALVNELAQIFNRIGIDTEAVLEAAATKWNFLPFRPGLVGGHCIGVDPYYLTHKALATGYQPTIIPASRLVNEGMGDYVASQTLKLMARHGIGIVGSKILIMGLAFKENCSDLRNTKVVDIVEALHQFHADVDIFDPVVDAGEAETSYQVPVLSEVKSGHYDAIIIAVAHDVFKAMGADQIRNLGKKNSVIYDVKSLLPKNMVHERL
jgi:UDP-N-acetyl-D-galactosamine dehydrogenase